MKTWCFVLLLLFFCAPVFSSTEWHEVITKDSPGHLEFDLARENNMIRFTLTSKRPEARYINLAYVRLVLSSGNISRLSVPLELKKNPKGQPFVEFDLDKNLLNEYVPSVVVYIGTPGLKGTRYTIMINSYF